MATASDVLSLRPPPYHYVNGGELSAQQSAMVRAGQLSNIIKRMKWLQSKFRREKEQEQSLIEAQSKKWQNIFKNRLFMTSLLNVLVFLVFVFSMCYYDWSLVTISTYTSLKQYSGHITLYVNLVYVKFTNQAAYSPFSNFYSSCGDNDMVCSACVSELEFIGALSFSLLILGSLFQIFDIGIMIHYLYILKKQQQRQYQEQKQDNLRHILTIVVFLVGITLNVFGMVESNVQFTYGVSFWVFAVGILCFIVIISYQQLSLGKYQQQKLILELIEKERNVARTIGASVAIELSSEGEAYI